MNDDTVILTIMTPALRALSTHRDIVGAVSRGISGYFRWDKIGTGPILRMTTDSPAILASPTLTPSLKSEIHQKRLCCLGSCMCAQAGNRGATQQLAGNVETLGRKDDLSLTSCPTVSCLWNNRVMHIALK